MTGPAATPLLRPALAGSAAILSGIGLSRFAYVPLFPAMVAEGWISGAEGGLLGALNLSGYLGGVLGARALARRAGTRRALTLGLILAAVALSCCAWNAGTAWLAVWRAVSGIAGGVLMALAGPAVQGTVAPERRGIAGGIVMSGVSLGIVAGALLVPALVPFGLSFVWLGLGALALAALLLVRRDLPDTPIPSAKMPAPRATTLHLSYGISAAGFVPHMVYFADLAVRGRGFSLDFATWLWLAFGLGTLCGPLLGGRAADAFGGARAFRVWLGLQIVSVGAALATDPALLLLSGFLGGFSAVGLPAIALARAREIAGPEAGSVWVRSTAAFAVAQAAGGLAFAALFAATASHDAVFLFALALSAGALLVALVGPALVGPSPSTGGLDGGPERRHKS